MPTSTSASTFESIGASPWIAHQLKTKNNFTTPLPVQSAVVPFANKAFSSWLLHCDVGLSSPTGSGKTLCYCLPMLQAIAEQKKRFAATPNTNDRHIRGVIVVPSSILAEQVNDVLMQLVHFGKSSTAANNKNENNNTVFPPEFAIGTLFRAADDGSDLYRKQPGNRCFGNVDILIATPQKLCSWIERLADEDDDEMQQQLNHSNNSNNRKDSSSTSTSNSSPSKLVDIFGRTQVVVLDEADDLLSTGFFTSMAGRIVETINEAVQQKGETVLHKMLCSATLTARISKVSDVKLQNAKYFSLDATGHEILGIAGAGTSHHQGGAVQNTATGDIVRQKFPLPSSLNEHLVIVRDDSKRHVTLLNVVRFALDELKKAREEKEKAAANNNNNDSNGEDAALVASSLALQQQQSWKTTGSSIIIFCQTAEVARVLGHFLSFAGIDALELTTLSSDAERRQAALAVATAKSTEQKVVVASDALMRGVDLPGVGAVIMYDPPTTLQQYVHRVGRTARAGADGHSYVLLSKMGPSGNEDDGQVALFKSFDTMLLRKGKVSNLVKLRELSDEEVAKADELLLKTRSRLGGTSAQQSSIISNNQKNKSSNENTSGGSKRRQRA